MASRIVWSDPEMDFLVSERRRRNDEYHFMFRDNKMEFWKSIAEEYIGDIIEYILLANTSKNRGI